MKVTVRRPTDIEVARVRCVLAYDEEDFSEQDLADFPGRMGGPRRGHIPLEIDLNTSRVVGWPEGRHASLHLKVVDSGIYTLIGANGKTLREHEDYVPDWLPGEYGDCFIADIQGDGAIFQDGKRWEADADEISVWLNGLIDEDDGR